jgi:Thioesterase-like superfamily
MRPVPTSPLKVDASVVREGKKLQLCNVDLLSDGVVVSRTRVLKLRTATLGVPNSLTDRPTGIAWPAEPQNLGGPQPRDFSSLHDIRAVRGGFRELGPASVWFNTHSAIVAGQANSPAMRAAAASDFGNGIASVTPFAEWFYLNADLSITLSRLPVDEWILLDSRTEVDDYGRGVTFSRLGDRQGWIGHATQTLLFEKR